MRIHAIILRLAALLVLLSSVCDYCAFDLYDSEASMSRPGPMLLANNAGKAIGQAKVRTSDLPDDHCLCCSPSIASQVVTLESPLLISSTVANQAIYPLFAEAQLIERPPRS
jgi:hypothetical protein